MTDPTVIDLPAQVRVEIHPSATTLIIGEFPSAADVRSGKPFNSNTPNGRLLDELLHSVGILRTECNITYVTRRVPPSGNWKRLFIDKSQKHPGPYLLEQISELKNEIAALAPERIIALGPIALLALTGEMQLTKWRGSQLWYDGIPVLPTYAPNQIQRQWPLRTIAQMDLQRLKRKWTAGEWKAPEYTFTTAPTIDAVIKWIDWATASATRLSLDIETRAGHIACIGFAWSDREAICIPLMDIRNDTGAYWNEHEETEIVLALSNLFRAEGISFALQNGLFDYQYLLRHWGLAPRELWADTMLEHHVHWAGDIPKGLDFLSSIHCDYHKYWKDDGKLWDPRYVDEDQLWTYNCKDCVTTWEIAVALETDTARFSLKDQVDFQLREQFPAVLAMMNNGVRCDEKRKGELSIELFDCYAKLEQELHDLVGIPLNVRSPKQMCEFFYGDLGAVVPVQKQRRFPYNPTCDVNALKKIKKKQPWLTPVIDIMLEMRSVGVFRSTFIEMPLDDDGRLRCSYNIAGTETFRYSSSANAFGSGGNLQNIPGKKDMSSLPNVKELFLPDSGYVIIDADLDRADAQVVAWEANDEELKQMFREGADIHLENAKLIFHNERLTKDSKERKLAKAGVHATNYGVSPRTLAVTLGITVREAERFINQWFAAHPGIADWHRRVDDSLATTRSVTNKFGFRRYYFDRVEGLLPEALAWVPQSTVAIVIDTGLVRVHRDLPRVKPMLQVHDSLVMQCPGFALSEDLPRMKEALEVVIPYDDPLTIPVGAEISARSWGHCRKHPWEVSEKLVVNW